MVSEDTKDLRKIQLTDMKDEKNTSWQLTAKNTEELSVIANINDKQTKLRGVHNSKNTPEETREQSPQARSAEVKESGLNYNTCDDSPKANLLPPQLWPGPDCMLSQCKC